MLIAAPSSGSGKTIVTLGLIQRLRSLGYRVQPFKAGPDYIDAGLLGALAGREAENLDPWLQGEEGARWVWSSFCREGLIPVVEGTMGLFDGGSGVPPASAWVAELFQLPVVVVLDVAGMGETVAAVAEGMARHRPGVKVAGFILNRVRSERHLSLCREALLRAGHRVLGWVWEAEKLRLPSRHLGLHTAWEVDVRRWAEEVAGNFHWEDREWQALSGEWWARAPTTGQGVSTAERGKCHDPGRLAASSLPVDSRAREVCDILEPAVAGAGPVVPRIAWARDRYFQFYYPANILILTRLGAEVIPFSPREEGRPPLPCHGLYLGGGYPELGMEELAGGSFFSFLQECGLKGVPVYAECGGMMVLGKEVEGQPGAGIIPFSFRRRGRRLGYVSARSTGRSWLPAGTEVRGHIFHYFHPEEENSSPAWLLQPGGEPDGWAAGGVLAGYLHLHFAGSPDLPRAFVRAAAHFARGAAESRPFPPRLCRKTPLR